jgi:hypothetical protein
MLRALFVAALVLPGLALARHDDRDDELLAFSKDGARVLFEDSVSDTREGGRKMTYRILGGGATVVVVPDNNISFGAGPQQHVSPAECRAAMKVLGAALRGFPTVKLNPNACEEKWRTNLVSLKGESKGNGVAFTMQGDTLTSGDLTLASDGEKVTLSRCAKPVASFALKIPPKELAATITSTGRLLLIYQSNGEGTNLMAIAESPSGRPEDLAIKR